MNGDDKYTYPGSGGVLINSRGLTDHEPLDAAMNDYASLGWFDLWVEPSPTVFDFEMLRHIHRTMFRPLFSWAGQIRDVDTVAGGTGIVYARPAFLEANIADMFGTLAADTDLMATDDPAEFAARLAGHWGYLSLIHPFRDGNTRSQSFFTSSLARAAGHPIDWRRIDVDELRNARLRAMQGHERDLTGLLVHAITGSNPSLAGLAPVFVADSSTTSGAAPRPADLAGRCGKPRSHGRGPCMRRIGQNGCPYHG